jgi:hypothetical protein
VPPTVGAHAGRFRCQPPTARAPYAGATHRARACRRAGCSACPRQIVVPPTEGADPGATHHVRPPLCASITARGSPMTSRHIVKGFRSRCHPPLELTPVGSGVWPRCHPPRWVPIPVPPTERLTPVPPTERPPTERPPKVKKAINVMLPGFCSACFCRFFGILRCLSSSGFLRDLSSSEFCGACPSSRCPSSRLPVLPAD